MLYTYATNSPQTATSALTSTSRTSRYLSTRSSYSPVRHYKQSTPISRARDSISRIRAANGTTTMLVGPAYEPDAPRTSPPSTAGSMKKMLLPTPVGSTTINRSLRTLLSYSAIILAITARYSSDFHYAAGPNSLRKPASISSSAYYTYPPPLPRTLFTSGPTDVASTVTLRFRSTTPPPGPPLPPPPLCKKPYHSSLISL